MNGQPPPLPALASAGYEATAEGGDAARRWWDASAVEYLSEHGGALGDAELFWGPEGWHEAQAGMLGTTAGRRVLEIGAGAAACSRWLARQGAQVVASDVSEQMLRAAADIGATTGITVPLVVADARALPFAAATFDIVFTSYGVLPFVPDAERVHAEVHRVLRPGGRWVFSTTHPVRWAFPDDPGPGGLTATRDYEDTRAYIERDAHGEVLYAEYHRTLAQHLNQVLGAGFALERVAEPSWQPGRQTWGGWSELRARHLPGTLVVAARR